MKGKMEPPTSRRPFASLASRVWAPLPGIVAGPALLRFFPSLLYGWARPAKTVGRQGSPVAVVSDELLLLSEREA